MSNVRQKLFDSAKKHGPSDKNMKQHKRFGTLLSFMDIDFLG